MNRNLKDDLRRKNTKLCQHEASHYVCSKHLGFNMVGCHIKAQGIRLTGVCEINVEEAISDIPSMINYAERRIQGLFAGAIGEALEGDAVNNGNAITLIGSDYECRSDHDKIRELIRLLANATHAEGDSTETRLNEIDRRLWIATTALVEKYADQIYSLRDAMLRAWDKLNGSDGEASLTSEECDAAMGISD